MRCVIGSALACLTALLCAPGAAAALPETPAEDAQVQAFIEDMAVRHGLAREALRTLFREAVFSQSVLDAFARPAEAKPWYEYRRIFLSTARIEGGVAFWRAHEPALRRAESAFGVPPEVVVAIIGVETLYGRHQGRVRTLDALTTLAFRYPRRSRFFRGELEAFLLLGREESLAVTSTVGSYAGALGVPQFIPSSYRRYAVDFDGDGRRDLVHSDDDAIGSVANYLRRHDWAVGGPVAFQVSGVRAGDPRLAGSSLKPQHAAAALRGAGIDGVRGGLPPGEVALFSLRTERDPEYWVGYGNFYAITRYNPSKLYAMAVFQLSSAIREAHAGNRG